MVPIDTYLEDCPPVLSDLLPIPIHIQSSMAQKREHFAQTHSCLAIVPQTLGTALEKFLYIINSMHCKGFEGQLVSECCNRASTNKSYSSDFFKSMGSEKGPNIKTERTALYFQPGCSYGIGFDRGFDKKVFDKEKVCSRQQSYLISNMAFLKIHPPQNCKNKFCLHKIFVKDYMENNPVALLHQLRVTSPSEMTLYRSSEILLARMVDFYLKFTLKSSSEPAFIDTRSLSISLPTVRSYTNLKSTCKNGMERNNKSKDCQKSDELNVVVKNCTKCRVTNICDMGKLRSCLRKRSTKGQDVSCDEVDFTNPKINKRKVKFAPPNKLCEVHPMIQWSYAYQAARKGPWEMHARDRDRFRWRIFRTEQDIKHVFDQEHRSKIYRERFENV